MTELFTRSAPTKPVDVRLIKTNAKGKPYIISAKSCSRCGGSGIYSAYHGACFKCRGRGTTGSREEFCFTAEQISKHLAKQADKRKAKAEANVAAFRRKTREIRALRGVSLAWAKPAIKAAWEHRHQSPILRDILKSVLRLGSCSEKQAEVLFRIANELTAKAVARPSEHVGTVGERLTFTLTLKRSFQIETRFGLGRIRIFADAAGNVIKSFGSIPQPWAVEETKTIVATVKRHGDYKEVRETVINRLALPKDKAPRAASRNVSVWA